MSSDPLSNDELVNTLTQIANIEERHKLSGLSIQCVADKNVYAPDIATFALEVSRFMVGVLKRKDSIESRGN